MKKIKILIIILLLFIVTGCSGTYTLKIDKDLKVTEEANLILEDEASNYNKFSDLIASKNIDNSKYKMSIKDNDIEITYNDEYSNIEDYLLNSVLYKQLFNNITYETTNKEIYMEASNIFNTTNSKLNNSNNIHFLQINVTTPLEIIEENSDSSSEKTYSWIIDNNTKEKDLILNFYPKVYSLNIGSTLVLASFILVIIVLIIIVLKRLSESRKI